jgi:transcriptional regulator with XRE-family HTH domain
MSEHKFYGGKLRLARTFQGLTLADLGAKVSVTKQYIQKLESDPGISPSQDMLYALPELLEVEVDFFFEPLTGDVTEEECHFRKLQTTPNNMRLRALSYGTIFNLIISYLDQELELPLVNIPALQVKSREDIENATNR